MPDERKEPPKVWSVSELTLALKRTLEAGFGTVDLTGEVSGFKRAASGHVYFTLKDADAQLAAVIFRRTYEELACRDAVRDGAELKVRGRLTTGPRSQYQIVVARARPLGDGELMRRYLELRAKLEAEGLFDASRKRPLPFLPRRIGLVTSSSGAVVHDLCRVLMRRFPRLEIRIWPAVVQGTAAPASLTAGLAYFNGLRDWRADVIVFGRGGGAFEDLFCFSDETFVRAVAASEIPTVSAVGHETDFSLADFAADVRAGTPSMAAELVVPEEASLRRAIAASEASLAALLRGACEWHEQRTDGLADDLADALWRFERESRARLDAAAAGLAVAAAGLAAACDARSQRLDARADALAAALRLRRVKAEAAVNELASKLALLSPYSVLERGYSLTTDAAGRVVRDAASLRPGDELRTRLQNGSVVSVVR